MEGMLGVEKLGWNEKVVMQRSWWLLLSLVVLEIELRKGVENKADPT